MASREEEKKQRREERERREAEQEQSDRRKRRLKLLAAALGGAVVIVIAAVLISSSGGDDDKQPTSTTQRAEQEGPVVGAASVEKRYRGVEQDGLALGDPKAPVTIVEFADLQCPFCKDASDNSLPPLVDGYVKKGELRMEFRNFPILGPDSEKAAKAVDAAGKQGKAWQFIELWYLNQGEENSGYVTDEFIRRIAGSIDGLDAEAVVKASNSDITPASVDQAQRDAQSFGIESTPSYLIGRTGQQLSQLQLTNPSDPTQYTQAVDQLLAEK